MDNSYSENNKNAIGDAAGTPPQSPKSDDSSARTDFLAEFSSKLSPDESCGDGQGDRNCTRIRLRNLTEFIDGEEGRLIELEERRRKLESDMERLQQEIELEKKLYRKAIDDEIERRQHHECQCKTIMSTPRSPFAITKEVENKLRECREIVLESRCQSARQDESVDINRLKANLAVYRKTLYETKHNRLAKQKRNAAAKIFQKHLEDIDLKCSAQIDNLNKIQQSIGDIHVVQKD